MPFRAALVPAAVLALLLAGCGGGGGGDLEPTPVPATITVSNATSPSFNGAYTSSAVSLTEVQKINPIGGQPEVCSFRFTGPAGPNGQVMSGDIRYIPGTNELRTTFVSIGGFEFRGDDPTNAAVDRANNRIVLNGKVLTASTGVASTIAVSGNVPMRGGRPEGC